MVEVGIDNAEWSVWSDAVPLVMLDTVIVMVRFRCRWGFDWGFQMPVSGELAREDPGIVLEMAWANFRYLLDRRYDDPFLFWPALEPGRWST